MIKSVRAKNFKSWKDTGDIRVAPITGFFGTNSSGKTSLLQMLLLMKQTAQSNDPKQVLFFGDENSIIDLGTFYDVVYGHNLEESLEMGITWESLMFGEKFATFRTAIKEVSRRVTLSSFLYQYSDTEVGIRLASGGTNQYQIIAKGELFEKIKSRVEESEVFPVPEHFYSFPLEFTFKSADFLALNLYSSEFEHILSQMTYLGPLREYPHRSYVWGGDSPSDVGRRGERTIGALLSYQNENDEHYLEQKVASWLQKMGLIYSFSLRPTAPGRRDYEIVVKKTTSSAEVLITDIGFGVSQVLPVLVLCYYVPEGSMIIFEQPEIHLHPSVQADLADVFIEVAKERNIQIIFESHSEYLLHRLQRRIAEEQLSKEDAALYFCSMGEEASQIEELHLDEYGNIANWPKDFFGDSTGDLVAMTEAAMKRKLAEQT